ncbi:DUF6236 family protein [Pseudomonas sp. LF242]
MKRGIVIPGAQFEAEPGRLELISTGVNAGDIRYCLFYFDLIERPVNNIIHIAPSVDEDYLRSCNILTNTEIRYSSMRDIGTLMFDCHAKAYETKLLNRKEVWSRGFSGATWIPGNEIDASTNLIEMTLYDTLPCPADDVPLAEILEFKLRRQSELEALRARLDEIYEQVSTSSDTGRAMSAALTRLAQAVTELNTVVDERFASRVLKGLKVQIDPMAIGGFASAGGLAAAGFGIPVALGLLAGAAISTIKFEYSRAGKNKKIPEGLRDFSYLYDLGSNLKLRK